MFTGEYGKAHNGAVFGTGICGRGAAIDGCFGVFPLGLLKVVRRCQAATIFSMPQHTQRPTRRNICLGPWSPALPRGLWLPQRKRKEQSFRLSTSARTVRASTVSGSYYPQFLTVGDALAL